MEEYETLQFEGNLLTNLPGKYFSAYKMMVNSKKSVDYRFFPRPSLGGCTIHGLSFHLRRSLLAYELGNCITNVILTVSLL